MRTLTIEMNDVGTITNEMEMQYKKEWRVYWHECIDGIDPKQWDLSSDEYWDEIDDSGFWEWVYRIVANAVRQQEFFARGLGQDAFRWAFTEMMDDLANP